MNRAECRQRLPAFRGRGSGSDDPILGTGDTRRIESETPVGMSCSFFALQSQTQNHLTITFGGNAPKPFGRFQQKKRTAAQAAVLHFNNSRIPSMRRVDKERGSVTCIDKIRVLLITYDIFLGGHLRTSHSLQNNNTHLESDC